MYRAQCAGRVLAHATTNTNTTRKQRHRAASPVAVRSPIQARITPRGARRDAYSPPMPPVFLHHQPPPSPCWQRRRLQLFCQRLRKGRQRSVERRRRSASLTSVRRALSCQPSPQPQPVALWAACSAPPAAAPPHRAPAVAVERLGKAQRHAPFARPATVRARVGGRIGPLAHGVRRRGQVAEHESGPFALGAHASPEPQAVPPTLRRPSRPRSRRTGPLLSHAERAALARRFAATRWSMGRTIDRRSVAQPSRGHRGQLHRPGAALERPYHAATTFTSASWAHPGLANDFAPLRNLHSHRRLRIYIGTNQVNNLAQAESFESFATFWCYEKGLYGGLHFKSRALTKLFA